MAEAPNKAVLRGFVNIRKLIQAVNLLFPWPVCRWLLIKLLGYEIHPSSRIFLAWIFPKHLIIEANSSIGVGFRPQILTHNIDF